MSIQKQITYNTAQEKYGGFVDYISIIPKCLENIASEAKGFILVGLRYSWNFPVTDNCDADI